MASVSAPTAGARPRRPRPPSGSRPRAGVRAAGVRWDRVGRVAMLCVLVALACLYLSAGIHMFTTWRQSAHDSAAVAAMQREHARLVRQHEVLSKQERSRGRPAGWATCAPASSRT